MMKNSKHKCLFIHIPRTGGKTIRKTLKGLIDTLPGDKGFHGYLRTDKYVKRYEKHLKFAFVRNPWDRVASAFCSGGKGSFEKHVKNFAIGAVPPPMEVPQWNYLVYDRVHVLDVVWKYEDFNDVMDTLCDGFGVPRIGHVRERGWEDYSKMYTKEMVDLVAEREHAVIKHFGYEFKKSKGM